MKCSVLAVSPSPLFLQPKSFIRKYNETSHCKPTSLVQAFHPSSISLCVGTFSVIPKQRCDSRIVAKAGGSESSDGEADVGEGSSGLVRLLQLGAMFATWYLLNIYFNIYNKQVLKMYPYPATLSAFQFGCGTCFVLLMWALNLHPRPVIRQSEG